MRHAGLIEKHPGSHAVRRPRAKRNSRAIKALALAMAALVLTGCNSAGEPRQSSVPDSPQARPQLKTVQAPVDETAEPPVSPVAPPPQPGGETVLFDGQALGQWTATDFGGQGDVYVKDGAIYMEMGSYMTGITWTGPVIRMNYEIILDAMRVQGNDFFCALTFPVGENPCTLVLGGWGGSVCGLSNIDYFDASENETTRLISFKTGRWYHVRLRVMPDRIQAWLDDEELVDVETTGHKIDIRPEVDLSRPLGIATWMTTGAVRDIRLRALPEESR